MKLQREDSMTVREISVEDVAMGSGPPLLDVRSPAEYAQGHVPGARNVPLEQVRAQPHRFTDQPVRTICASGRRSYTAAQAISAAGGQAESVAGGTRAWVESGRPVEQGH
ncbi:rhodanese-like domain-containing protein [Salinactinospora qingdaonensis]|uniref:Rhodanese domain-containing protein n=1 Tax=Salinactinospora qingdaonensis TaxID=702744 RepID=A0ABP7GAC8_9ACTN